MHNHLSIDLVICTYNNAALLDRALIAISKQQVSPEVEWKVLVVDNNCTDGTSAVLERHAKSGKIPDLGKVSESRQGLTYARLCGVDSTTGDWIAFVDDDCLLEENWVDQVAKFALTHPECGALGGRVILDWETPPPAFVLKYRYSFAAQDHGRISKQVSCLVGAGLVIRRSALLESGWRHQPLLHDRVGTQLISGGDVEIALRIRSTGSELWYNPECQLMHVIPARRTSIKYLVDINYGLGTSQVYGDSMLWPGSYSSWLFVSTFDATRSSVDVLIQGLKAAIRRRSATEVAINTSFVLGKWVGIGRLFWMKTQDRQALLGAAKVAVS